MFVAYVAVAVVGGMWCVSHDIVSVSVNDAVPASVGRVLVSAWQEHDLSTKCRLCARSE